MVTTNIQMEVDTKEISIIEKNISKYEIEISTNDLELHIGLNYESLEEIYNQIKGIMEG